MRILIIDRDPLASKLMSSRLEQMGHEVVCEDSKNRAVKEFAESWFDCILVDPAPLTDVRPVVLEIWRSLQKNQNRPYMVLLSKTEDRDAAVSRGCNDLLVKPLDVSALEEVIGNAERLNYYCEAFDQETQGAELDRSLGVLEREAFQQLFLSALDRGFRYGERNCVLFLHMKNLKDIAEKSGEDVAEEAMNACAKEISWIRRQSDVVGRVAYDTFSILMQRPIYETEVFDAFSRFTEKTKEFVEKMDADKKLDIALSVIELPYGALVCDETKKGLFKGAVNEGGQM